MPSRHAIFLLFLLIANAVRAEQALEVIPLNHRLADEIAPLLQPLLTPGDVVVPNRTQLIVRASPDKLLQIKQLLTTLDRRPHRLLISVRQGGSSSAENLNALAGAQGEIPLNQPGQASLRLRGTLHQTDSDESRDTVQRIQVLEGSPAKIQFGVSRPIAVPLISAYGNQVIATTGGGYQSLTTGFAVVAHLTGDGSVMLDVAPWSARPDPGDSRKAHSQQASTSLRASIGKWISIGGQSDDRTVERSELLGHGYSSKNESNSLLIKVDDLDAGQP